MINFKERDSSLHLVEGAGGSFPPQTVNLPLANNFF